MGPSKKMGRQYGLVPAALVFLIVGALASVFVWTSEASRLQAERMRTIDDAGDHAHAIESKIAHASTATFALGALVRQGGGDIADFDRVAGELLPAFPGVLSLQLAPAGVVKKIVPFAGNEAAIGHDLLRDPARNREALLARDSGRLTLAGPFPLRQGGVAVVARLPVFLEQANAAPIFWGFTIAVMRLSDLTTAADLLTGWGYQYELWRIDPASGQRQTIARPPSGTLHEPVELGVSVPNGEWVLGVMPAQGWSDPAGLALKLAIALLISLLVGYLTKVLLDLKAHEQGLEAMVALRTDEVLAREADLNRDTLRDEIVYYLDGYVNAFYDFLEGEEE